MNKIQKLAENIIKDDRMTSSEVMNVLTENINDSSCVYSKLYESAYGKTITKDLADEWVKSMSVTDGSERENGMKWTYEQTSEAGSKAGVDWHEVSKTDWYAVMNMMYSDHYATAKAVEKQNDVNFFVRLAKDWFCDDDVDGGEKLYNYYFCVVCA